MIFRLIIAAALAAMLWSCGSGSDSNRVAEAVDRFDARNFAASREIVDRLAADTTGLDTMSVADLCSLAALCVRLDSVGAPGSDNTGEALAARCLIVARRQNPDSVEAFLHTLPRETAQLLGVIDRVATYLVIPRDSLVVESDTVQ